LKDERKLCLEKLLSRKRDTRKDGMNEIPYRWLFGRLENLVESDLLFEAASCDGGDETDMGT